jgi:hypothetical protein
MAIKIIPNKFQFIDKHKKSKKQYWGAFKADLNILFENKRKSKILEDIERESLLSTFAGY